MQLRRQLRDLDKKLAEKMNGTYGEQACAALEKKEPGFFNLIKNESPAVATKVEAYTKAAKSGAEKVAEKTGKWWQKDMKALEELAAKEGVTVEKLGAWKSSSTGVKLGAGALILGSAYAAFGRNGSSAAEPGKSSCSARRPSSDSLIPRKGE